MIPNIKNYQNSVAIIGLGFRLPSGFDNGDGETISNSINNCKTLWDKLMNGFDGIVKTDERWSSNYSKLGVIDSRYAGLLPLKEWKSFDPLLFGVNPNSVSLMDPQQRLLLHCTFEALEDAQIDPLSIRGSNTCVHIGSSAIDYQHINKNEIVNNIFSCSPNSIANRISYCFDLHGESITLDTACSSSLNALLMGYNAILQGKSKISISGGVNMISNPVISESFSNLNMTSKSGKCRPFDKDADGYVRSEGVGVIIMKSLNDAIEDGDNIYCVINGISSNVDGNGISDKSNFYQPSSLSQADNIKKAILSTNGLVKESDIQYVEAHGTGTPAGDPIECKGISIALNSGRNNDKTILIGSIKSNIGHLEACSGVASLIKCCLMLKNKYFVPNINFNSPNPDIKFDEWKLKVVTKPIPFNENKITTILLNNFGITGSNCCLVLSEFKNGMGIIKRNNNDGEKSKFDKLYLIPFSSNSSVSLDKYQNEILNNLESIKSNISFDEFVKYQIYSKSMLLCQRSVIMANDWDNYKEQSINQKSIIKTKNLKSLNLSNIKKNPITIFIFCGHGSQWNRQGLELYNNEPYFKEIMDMLDYKFYKYFNYSILKKLRCIPDEDLISIQDPILAQPATCMLQVALFELYKMWGVNPSFIIGHSLGELTSAYCSGMVDLDTFIYMVYSRAVAQSKTNGTGKMLSTLIDDQDFKLNYSSKYPSIEVSCYNSPKSIVIAGNENELIEISKSLKSRNIHCAFLGSLASFHTKSQLMIKDDIHSMKFKSNSPKIPCFSTVTSKLFDDSTPYTPEYMFENITHPVKFSQTIINLYQHIQDNNLGNEITFIELAPHSTLDFYLKHMMPSTCDQINSNYFSDNLITTYSPLSKKKPNDYFEFLKTISNLYCNSNYQINFKYQFLNKNHLSNTRLNDFKNHYLPHYQFDQQEYWNDDSKYLIGPSIDILGNQNLKSPFYKSFTSSIDIKKKPFSYLKGHLVKENCYFPGVGYISNIINIFSNHNISISSIDFGIPLIFKNNSNSVDLQTNIYSTSKNEFRAQFNFRNSKDKGEWLNSSNANLQLILNESDNLSDKLNFNEIKNNHCNLTKLSKSEVYGSIKLKTGLNYLGSFQGVSELYLGNKQSLVTIPLNQTNEIDKGSFFNAALLDTCLHGLLFLAGDQCSLVLDKIEYFNYFASNIPSYKTKFESNSVIHVYSVIEDRIGNSYKGRVKIFLPDGTMLIDIENAWCTSLTQIKDCYSLEYPKDIIFSRYLQSKDSPLNLPKSFEWLYNTKEFEISDIIGLNYSNYPEMISTLLYKNINSRITKLDLELIHSLEIDQLFERFYNTTNVKTSNLRLFKFVFETIKKLGIVDGTFNYPELLIKNTNVIGKLLFPQIDEDPMIDTPKSLYQEGFIDKYYTNSDLITPQINLCSEIIKQSIKPLISEKMVFRILEFGGGNCSLTTSVLNKIFNLLNEYPNDANIDIEFTWSDISQTIIEDAKNKLSNFTNDKRIQIIFKELDLNKTLLKDQELKPSYYDLVIMSNVLNIVNDIKFSLNEINKIITPNGHLLFIELPFKSIIFDCLFGVFEPWWNFEDFNLRNERSTMNQESWRNILNDCNFNNTLMSNDYNNSTTFIIHTQKSKLNQLLENNQNELVNDQIIVFKNENQSNYWFNENNNNLIQVYNIQQFKEINITDNSIIYFIKPIDSLTIENFKTITMEYIEINQILLKLKSKCKNVLFTLNATKSNYLASSLVGSFIYFLEFPQLQLFSIDFDNIASINHSQLIKPLLISEINNQRQFMIKDEKVYYERFKRESLSTLKKEFKSESFVDENSSSDELYLHLNLNLEYVLRSRTKILEEDQVEIQVKATGINYKDYLVYCGLLPPEMMNHSSDVNNPEIGCEFSGVITKVGDNVCEFKVGDSVYGMGYNTTSSHIVIDKHFVYLKPSSISHVQASSIPIVYLTSYHSIYNVGNLKGDESILIHSGTGGIGLSALNILKWKNHKGLIFVTVGSNEKQKYLLDTYGSFINGGIYSTRNHDYTLKIKDRLSKQYKDKQGVDLILNTLNSSEFMDSNFRSLDIGGRIVDLSITHLNQNEFTLNNKFKYNYSYHNVELVFVKKQIINQILKSITMGLESNNLDLIPINEFSNENVKDAIEFINKRIHIGKIVVNNEKSNLFEKLIGTSESTTTTFFNNDTIPILKSNLQYKPSNIGKNLLLTGQAGVVLEIFKWILKYSLSSLENVIILSRSSLRWEMEYFIKKYKNQIKFHFVIVDVSNSELVDKSLNDLFKENPQIDNIDTILHFAYQHATCNEHDIDIENLNISHGAKTMGAINLHDQSIKRNWKLTNFILASSVTSVIGSYNQCSYVGANKVLDALSSYRRSIGLPCLATNWGAFAGAGVVARNDSLWTFVEDQGLSAIPTSFVLGALDLQIQNQNQSNNLIISKFNFQTFKELNQIHHQKFDFILNQIEDDSKNSLSTTQFDIGNLFLEKISQSLSIDIQKIDIDLQLNSFGVDSLMLVQLKNWVDKEVSQNILNTQQLSNNKISASINIIKSEFEKKVKK